MNRILLSLNINSIDRTGKDVLGMSLLSLSKTAFKGTPPCNLWMKIPGPKVYFKIKVFSYFWLKTRRHQIFRCAGGQRREVLIWITLTTLTLTGQICA